MNLKRVVLAAAVSLSLVAAWFLFGPAAAQDKKGGPALATKWEYKVIRAEPGKDGREVAPGKVEEALNKLGEEGWECIGTVGEVTGSNQQGTWTKAALICKRPRR